MAQVLKESIKREIKISAIDLFTLNGYKKTSMKAIAEKTGLSVGNLYRYYESKYSLYKDVISGVYDGVTALVKKVEKFQKKEVMSEAEIIQQLHQSLQQFLLLYHEEEAVFSMILKGERDQLYEETILAFVHILKDDFLNYWDNIIQVSAFSHAIIFGTIDLLEQCEIYHYNQKQIEEQLVYFINPLVRGLINGKESEGENEK